MRQLSLAALICLVGLNSCQPVAKEERPVHQPAVLDFTMLGIWSERYQAYEISNALGEVGIRSSMSGVRPCILNVETAKLGQAESIIAANPKWQQFRIR